MTNKLLALVASIAIALSLTGCGLFHALIVDQAERSDKVGKRIRKFKSYETGRQQIDLDHLLPDSY